MTQVIIGFKYRKEWGENSARKWNGVEIVSADSKALDKYQKRCHVQERQLSLSALCTPLKQKSCQVITPILFEII